MDTLTDVRRVAVTGLGAVTPIGNDVATSWESALAGRSGVDWIQAFDASEFPVRVAAEVKDFDPTTVASAEGGAEARALRAALARRGEGGGRRRGRSSSTTTRTGIVFGSAIGGLPGILEQADVLRERGLDRVSPNFLPNVLVDSASGQLAISLGIRGPNYAVVSACATGSHAVGEGAELIKRGDADVVLAGGAESVHAPADPRRVLRDARAGRGGGAPAARVAPLRHDPRRLRHGRGRVRARARGPRGGGGARARTSTPRCVGYGASNDAHHMAQPDPESKGVVEMMRAALRRGGIEPERVGYINAHGTSTPLGDLAETRAIKDVFGEHAYRLAVSSTKSVTGHCFGAAGAIEAMMCALALKHQVLPPTANYEVPDPELDLDYVPNEAREAELDVALSNAMGLGGHNGCVLLARYGS